ncbi:hypothetical protein RchiOBHm_Chr7g0243221 [Rosa chinensis]|uniref:Uncharacterized protein n=1 Tax=Rosa chinensis TaxID=74649 RepID=A0A2P6PIP4_ROSCH|nr:hypothetical protein RchiOBHm_Chr7g0243221 [Rosa chinensis]
MMGFLSLSYQQHRNILFELCHYPDSQISSLWCNPNILPSPKQLGKHVLRCTLVVESSPSLCQVSN